MTIESADKYDQTISVLREVTYTPGFSIFSGIGGFSDVETVICQCDADKLTVTDYPENGWYTLEILNREVRQI